MSGHVIRGPYVELKRERDAQRWCFQCRKRLAGTWLLLDYAEPSYYEPIWVYRCDGCKKNHRDFPGTVC